MEASCARMLEIAEALAVRRGISLEIELGLVPFMVETDCLQVVHMVRNGDSFNGEVGPIINDIVVSQRSLPSCSFSFVPRIGNVAAYSLAKLAISSVVNCCWLDSFPPYVERPVLLDASF
ncbi:hypothetical protein QYF36_006559 [Acer negundo]|nr:hypothetical protein QYF36_006559 [Acer negundo]